MLKKIQILTTLAALLCGATILPMRTKNPKRYKKTTSDSKMKKLQKEIAELNKKLEQRLKETKIPRTPQQKKEPLFPRHTDNKIVYRKQKSKVAGTPHVHRKVETKLFPTPTKFKEGNRYLLEKKMDKYNPKKSFAYSEKTKKLRKRLKRIHKTFDRFNDTKIKLVDTKNSLLQENSNLNDRIKKKIDDITTLKTLRSDHIACIRKYYQETKPKKNELETKFNNQPKGKLVNQRTIEGINKLIAIQKEEQSTVRKEKRLPKIEEKIYDQIKKTKEIISLQKDIQDKTHTIDAQIKMSDQEMASLKSMSRKTKAEIENNIKEKNTNIIKPIEEEILKILRKNQPSKVLIGNLQSTPTKSKTNLHFPMNVLKQGLKRRKEDNDPFRESEIDALGMYCFVEMGRGVNYYDVDEAIYKLVTGIEDLNNSDNGADNLNLSDIS